MLCDASALAPHCACGSASWRLTHVTQTQSVRAHIQPVCPARRQAPHPPAPLAGAAAPYHPCGCVGGSLPGCCGSHGRRQAADDSPAAGHPCDGCRPRAGGSSQPPCRGPPLGFASRFLLCWCRPRQLARGGAPGPPFPAVAARRPALAAHSRCLSLLLSVALCRRSIDSLIFPFPPFLALLHSRDLTRRACPACCIP